MGPYTTLLDINRKEIRVITIYPGDPSAEIRCTFSIVSLAEDPEYEALSYVWGDASMLRNIIFNGASFPVTLNLFIALRYLRSVDQQRKVWIDALCINQKDFKERNEQVQMMGEIYVRASTVLVWLGEADEDSDKGFELVKSISEKGDITEEAEIEIFGFFFELVERQWFTRLWTVQEMALATHEPLVGCGHEWLPWNILMNVWRRVADSQFQKMGMAMRPPTPPLESVGEDQTIAQIRPNGIKFDLLDNIRDAVSESAGHTFRNLLLDTQSSKVSEPRDRIYALRGMMRETERNSITVDYRRPVGMVYAEATAHIFQQGEGPFFLSGVQLTGCSEDPSCPSWVPSFGSDSLLHPIQFHPPGAGVSGAGSQCENGVIDGDLRTLRVRGMCVDRVIEKLDFGGRDECLGRLPAVAAMADRARKVAASNDIRSYLNKFKDKEPLWRTLIANKKYSGAEREAAPDSYEDMYYRMLGRDNSILMEDDDDDALEYKRCLFNHLPANSFFVTATGFCGVAPEIIQEGDQLAIWFAAPAPFILRGKGEQQETVYTVHGVAYVAGIMDGEMVDEIYCEDLEDDEVFVVE